MAAERSLKNIVLVGTKLDLVEDHPEKREVSLQDAVDFANKFGLAGVVETSSKRDVEGKNGNQNENSDPNGENEFCAVNDCFSMCACNCVDEARRQLMDAVNARNAKIKQNTIKNFLHGSKASGQS